MRILDGKIALVTGAARGIGLGIALCLAEAGADIVLNDIAPEAAMEEAAGTIRKLGRQALPWTADVSNHDAVDAMVKGVTQRLGGVDIAVANAAFSIRRPFVEFEWDEVEKVLATTQFGVFHTCQLAARQMIAQGRGGKIVLIASIHAQFPFALSTPYNMAKAGITHLGLTMANELASERINVNVIHPGWIDTPGERKFATEKEIQEGAAKIPWRRLGTPKDIGEAVTFLVSPNADYITGACLRIDGGLSLGLKLA